MSVFADTRNADASTAKGREKGAAVKKEKLLPSQTFDWDKARRLNRKARLKIYGTLKEEEETS